MIPIVLICALVTAAALFYIFRPLLIGSGSPFYLDLEGSPSSLKRLLRRKEIIYENIKDLEFEYKMGKFSEDDYQRLREDYSREAFEVISKIEAIKPETLDKVGKPQVVAVLKSPKKTKK
jgi:hypothetical protein